MLAWVGRLLAPPSFEDEEKARSARLLNVILWTLVALAIAAGAATVLANLGDPGEMISGVVLSGLFALPTVAGQWLLRSGRVRLASLLLVGLLYLGFTYAIVDGGGVGTPVASTYILLLTVASLLLRRRIAIISIGIVILTGVGLVYAESVAGWIQPRLVGPAYAWTTYSLVAVFVAILLYLANDSIGRALAQVQRYANELRAQQDAMEGTVEERTRALERRSRYLGAIASIARDTASLTDVDDLLRRAVGLIGERFGFYHVGVYVVDASGEWAVLRAASSDEGHQMVTRGHRVGVGHESLVGSVAEGTGARIASGVESDEVFRYNPDLPETRCEMALPLRVRGGVIGVLDIQSTELSAFGEQDMVTFQILADQVGMAIGNAQSFQQIQESLNAERRAYGQVTDDAWRNLLATQSGLGYLRDRRGLSPASNLLRSEMREAMRSGKVTAKEDDPTVLAVPITARGQVIGAVDVRKPRDAGRWTEQEIALLEALRDQLGEALENARLYGDVQHREASERVVGAISSRMRESLSIDAVLQTAIREIGEALSIDEVEVRMRGEARADDSADRGNGGEVS